MSTSAQQAGTLSPFPGICALHTLLLSVYNRMVRRASREHLSGGDPLLHTVYALPILLSIYKRVVGRASREHLSGGDPLWCITRALHALLSIFKRVVGRASREHLSGGDPLWYTTCALHALLSITKVHEYLPSASDDQTSHLETPCWAGASRRPLDQGSSPGLGLLPRYPSSAGALVRRLDWAQFILRVRWTWLV